MVQSEAIKQRVIDVEISLSGGRTFSGGGDTKSYQGAAIGCRVRKRGLPTLNECTVDIANINQADVELLTTTSMINLEMNRNVITVKAGNVGETLSIVFQGEIFLAYGTYTSSDLGIHIESSTGVFPKLTPVSPFTFEGKISAKQIIEQYTAQMGYTFVVQDDFEDVEITDPVLNGSPLDKIIQVGEMIGAQVICDDFKIILSDYRKGLGNAINVAPEPNGQLWGYPFFSPGGVNLHHEYNPKFRQGGYVQISGSMVSRANGLWKIIKLDHNLQCFGEGGAWETYIEGVYPDVGSA